MGGLNLMADSAHLVEVSRSVEPVEEEPDDKQVIAWLTGVLSRLNCAPSELSVRIVGEDEITSLNAQYRDRSNPTNVLSFPSGIEADGHVFLGDIVVCSKVVGDEAKAYQKSYSDRYAHMMVHGLLHLLGHNHAQEREQREMEALETAILADIGIADPYEVQE